MRTDIVLTLTGPDRVGVVEEVTKALLVLGGNVGTSRMARLGGEFAILMMVSLPVDALPGLTSAFESLTARGYKLTSIQASGAPPAPDAGCTAYRVEVRGADHEGIVYEIAHGLANRGINIESMETGTSRASVSGIELFTMSAVVSVPPSVAETDWMAALVEAGQQSNVDVEISLANAT
jgi:glycine cleavage system transcriptional repressor